MIYSRYIAAAAILAFLFCISAVSVSGDTIIVDDDWAGADHDNIQDAVNASENGDVIWVFEGVYNESLHIERSISIVGNGSDNTSITANGTIIELNASWVNVSNLNISNPIAKDGWGITGNSSYANIERCHLWNLSTAIEISGRYVNITNNLITDSYYGIWVNEYQTIVENVIEDAIYGVIAFPGNNLTITNNSIVSSLGVSYGIYAYRSDEVTVDNNTVSCSRGLRVYECTKLHIRSNAFDRTGISIYGTEEDHWSSHIMVNNTVSGRQIRYYANKVDIAIVDEDGPLIIGNCTDVNITNLTLTIGGSGIQIAYSTDIFIDCTIIESISGYGFYGYECQNVTLNGSEFRDIDSYVVMAEKCNGITLLNNHINDSGRLTLTQCVSAKLKSNSLINTACSVSASGATVVENRISGAGISGSGEGILVARNTIEGGSYGVSISSDSDADVNNNTILNTTSSGIKLRNCHGGSISSNDIINSSGPAIEVVRTNGFTIFNNTINSTSGGSAIYSDSGEGHLISGNVINGTDNGNAIEVFRCNGTLVENNVITNTTNGNAIQLHGRSWDPLSCNATSNVITNTSSGDGFHLERVTDCNLSNNVIRSTFNGNGLMLEFVDNSTFNNNTITRTYDDDGIVCLWIYDSRFKDNMIRNTSNGIGILLIDAIDCRISTSVLSRNVDGVFCRDSKDISIVHNTFYENNGSGCFLSHDAIGTVHRNNFIDNVNGTGPQATGLDDGEWDNGRTGNYWSDYNGSDSDGDGIGDTPYAIAGGAAQDNYPLMVANSSVPDNYDIIVDDDWAGADFYKIQDAINASENGDIIRVFEGDYTDEDPIVNRSVTIKGNLSFMKKGPMWISETGLITIVNTSSRIDRMSATSIEVETDDCVIINSSISGAVTGVEIQSVDRITVKNSWINGTGNSLFIYNSGNNTFKNLTLWNRYGIYAIALFDTEISDCVVGPNEQRAIHLEDSIRVTINDSRFFESNYGIYLEDCKLVEISGNDVYDNVFGGIYLRWSDNNSVHDNEIENSDDAFRITGSRDNDIQWNTFRENDRGFDVDDASWSIISNNTLVDCEDDGMVFQTSHNNTIANNIFINNSPAITFNIFSADNVLYFNEFILNDRDPVGQVNEQSSNNTWDDGIQGNYWSDYNGSDGNGDGIGDTPHPLGGSANAEDRYPLMDPVSRKLNITVDDDWAGADFDNIQDALDYALPYSIIRVHAGTYYGPLLTKRTISLIGNGTGNTIIDGNGTGDIFNVSADGCLIDRVSFTNGGQNLPDAAIEIRGEGCNIVNTSIDDTRIGLYLFWGDECVVDNLTITDCYFGMFVYTHDNVISNCSMSDNDYAVLLYQADRNMVERINATGNLAGIYLLEASSNILHNITSVQNMHGVVINTDSDNNWFFDTTSSRSSFRGFYILDSDSNTLTNCKARNNTDAGFEIFNGSGNNIVSSYGDQNYVGISITNVYSSFISDCDIFNSDIAIDIRNDYGSVIENSTIMYNDIPLSMRYSNYTIIRSSTLNQNGDHATIEGSYGVELDRVTMNGNSNTGLEVRSSNDTLLRRLAVENNDHDGIYLIQSSGTRIMSSTLKGNQNSGISTYMCPDTTLTEIDISYSGSYGLYLRTMSNLIVNNCSVDDSSDPGVYMNGVHNSSVNDTTVTDSHGYGIHMLSCNYVSINGSTLLDNYAGIYLEDVHSSTISWTEIGDTSIWSSIISDGVYIGQRCTANTIRYCNIHDMDDSGVYITTQTERNRIYLNRFKDNGDSPMGTDRDGDNYWDNGEYGNYWSDYNGSDADGDGIGETPYTIGGSTGARDRYPLTNDTITVYTNVWVVDDDEGWWSDFDSIRAALSAARNGDTIMVYAGLYEEQLQVFKEITIIGNGTTIPVGTRGYPSPINHSMLLGEGTDDEGIRVYAANVALKGITLSSFEDGIIGESENLTLDHMFLTDMDTAVELAYGAHNSSITNTTFWDNELGVWINEVDNCSILHNRFRDVDVSINGLMTYYANLSYNIIVEGSKGIEIQHANMTVINDNEITDAGDNIWVYGGRMNNITGNEITDGDIGVALINTHSNNVSENELFEVYRSLHLSTAAYNDIHYNLVISSRYIGAGLYISSYNDLRYNNFTNSDRYGIYSQSSHHNTFVRNDVHRNDWHGCIIDSDSFMNHLYGNHFFNNNGSGLPGSSRNETVYQVLDYGSNNQWDTGVYGNYWSEYTGPDRNNDGIGDTPHPVPGSGNSTDRYPLVEPTGRPPVNLVPWVVLVNITSSDGNDVFETSTLDVEVVAWDPDGDPLNVTHWWYRNGAKLVLTENATTLTGVSFDKGDAIHVRAIAHDGQAYSTPLLSRTVTVRNSPPVIIDAYIWPGSTMSGHDIEYRFHGFDPDGDGLSVHKWWYRNVSGGKKGSLPGDGSEIPGFEAPIHDAKLFREHSVRGDRWMAVLNLSDEDSPPLHFFANFTINDTPPVPLISSPQPFKVSLYAEPVEFNGSMSYDPDANLTYRWYIDNIKVNTSVDFRHSMDVGTYDVRLEVEEFGVTNSTGFDLIVGGPDLLVSSESIDIGGQLKDGKRISFTVMVNNIGAYPSDCVASVTIYRGVRTVKQTYINLHVPGHSSNASVVNWTGTKGSYRIEVAVTGEDYDLNRSNQAYSWSFKVEDTEGNPVLLVIAVVLVVGLIGVGIALRRTRTTLPSKEKPDTDTQEERRSAPSEEVSTKRTAPDDQPIYRPSDRQPPQGDIPAKARPPERPPEQDDGFLDF